MINANSVTKKVKTSEGELVILDSVSLAVKDGESLAIVGASGSGKSTLLGILAGLDTPTSGEIMLNGCNLTSMDEEGRAKVRADNVGFVFQSFQLLPGLSALENVMMPLELHGKADAEEKSKAFLQRVGLENRMNHYPKQLSGGEQQRVAMARAFASEPKILFADEPTGNLDYKTAQSVNELMFDLNRDENTSFLIVSHDLNLANSMQTRYELIKGSLSKATAELT